MVIRKKADIDKLITTFHETMPFAEKGKKHYLLFRDEKRDGEWALMRYADGLFTAHGRGEKYCDQGERVLRRADLHAFIWTYRKAINEALKQSLLSV